MKKRRAWHGIATRGACAVCALWLTALPGGAHAREYCVAPAGGDANPGTRELPFVTIARARDAVREAVRAGLKEDVTVLIRGGLYRLDETLVFGLEDSAPAGRSVTYAAWPGEKPILTSGAPIRDWSRLAAAAAPATLPAAARGNVWGADLPAAKGGQWRFRTLWDGDRRLPRARSQGYAATTPPIAKEKRWTDLDTLRFPKGALRNWENLEDVEILIRPNHVWVVNYLGLASVEEATGVAKTSVPGTYNLNRFSRNADATNLWVENVLEALDSPGEWVLDTRAGRLYLWPPDGAPSESIVAPRLRELIRVEGRNVDAIEGDAPVTALHFKGLTLTCADRDVWTAQDKGLQHDWEMWDKGNALIRFRGARDCSLEQCELRDSGGGGVRLDRYAQNIRITGNTIHDLGGTGVLLCGYGPGLKDVNKNNIVAGNDIHACGQLHLHNPGIMVWQSGENTILNNRVHDFPYNAIVLDGVRPRFFGITDPVKWKWPGVIPKDVRENMRAIRWDEVGQPKTAAEARRFAHARNNLVQDNEVHDAMQVLGDGNAIYLSCAGEGNVIRRNLVYNSPRAATQIRFDDDQELATVEQNVVIGNGLTLKHTNFILNNVFIGDGIAMKPETAAGCKVERNIFMLKKGADFYAASAALLTKARPDRNVFQCADEKAGRAFLAKVQQLGHERQGLFADPLFVDAARFDFRLKPDSPARALGIESIEMEQIGLPNDPALARIRKTGLVSTASCGELLASGGARRE